MELGLFILAVGVAGAIFMTYMEKKGEREQEEREEQNKKSRQEYWKKEAEKRNKEISKIKKTLLNYNKKLITEFDRDKNNIVDVVEVKDDFNLLLKKHNDIIIERGKEYNKNYIHQFVKVSNYIKEKRTNINLIFKNIKKEIAVSGCERRMGLNNEDPYLISEKNNDIKKECESYFKILRGEIHSYNLLLFNALNLISTVVENDQITFYNIYEKLDKLNIFNSNWQNEMSQKLTNIDNSFKELSKEIKDMGDRIVDAIWDLSYATEETNDILKDKLSEINSGIEVNNLLTLINTFKKSGRK